MLTDWLTFAKLPVYCLPNTQTNEQSLSLCRTREQPSLIYVFFTEITKTN